MPGARTFQTAPPRPPHAAAPRPIIPRDIAAVAHAVDPAARRARNRHGGGAIWLTGLSGAGKTTLAKALERRLFDAGYQVYALDGDNMRGGLSADPGFPADDRAENIRRISEVAAPMAPSISLGAGPIAIAAFISPCRADRARACTDGAAGGAPPAGSSWRSMSGPTWRPARRATRKACPERRRRSLYARARAGEIADFTGVSAPYEAPEAPELIVDMAPRRRHYLCLQDRQAFQYAAAF